MNATATTDSLFVPSTKLLFGERAFQVAAPQGVESTVPRRPLCRQQ